MRKLRTLAVALTAAIAIMSILGVYLVLDELTSSARDGRADRADLRNELGQQEQKTAILAKQLEALGETPAVQPSPTGALPPTSIRYVPIPGPRGLPGPPGIDGSDGNDGAAGPAGAIGATGPAGPTGKDGANGKDGTDGVDGKDGRGVSSVTCGDDGAWTITYTDGTSSTTNGPCRVLVGPPDK